MRLEHFLGRGRRGRGGRRAGERGSARLPGWPLVAALLLAWGCAGEGDPNPREATEVRPAPAAVVDEGDSTRAGSATAIALDGEGLRIVNTGSGSARLLSFGTPEETLRDAVAASLHAEPIESGSVADCALDYSSWEAGLTTWFRGGRFVGWGVPGPAAALTTMSGIGIGSSRAQLESVYAAEVGPSSLGMEFSAGGLNGILEGESDSARITHLWSGQACIAR